VRRRGGRVRVSLESAEVALLLHLSAQVADLLGDPSDTDAAAGALGDDPANADVDPLEQLIDTAPEPIAAPDDPVVHRLLPDAYRDDTEAAGEFRRLTDADLRAAKRRGLSQITADLTGAESVQRGGAVRLELDEEQASAWLPALTDIRLALGTRMDVTEDMDEERMELPVDSPRYAELATYDWLSWLQDAMVRALTGL
jgi:hypothetical protein